MDKKEIMLLVGLVFGLAAGFVLGWLWGDRPNYLSDVRVLDVLIAIGTIGAAIGAAYAAKVALDAGVRQAERENEAKKLKAEIAGFALFPIVRVTYNQLNSCLNQYGRNDIHGLDIQTIKLINLINSIDSGDLRSYADLDKLRACRLAEIKSYLNGFYSHARDNGGNHVGGCNWVLSFYKGEGPRKTLESMRDKLNDISENMGNYNVELQRKSSQIVRD